jgi:hypothetical protein
MLELAAGMLNKRTERMSVEMLELAAGMLNERTERMI